MAAPEIDPPAEGHPRLTEDELIAAHGELSTPSARLARLLAERKGAGDAEWAGHMAGLADGIELALRHPFAAATLLAELDARVEELATRNGESFRAADLVPLRRGYIDELAALPGRRRPSAFRRDLIDELEAYRG